MYFPNFQLIGVFTLLLEFEFEFDFCCQKSHFWPTKKFKNYCFYSYFSKPWVCQKRYFWLKKSNSGTTLQQILLPYYYYKVVSELHQNHKKVFFVDIYNLGPFLNKIPIVTEKLTTTERKSTREKTKTVSESDNQGEQLGNMQKLLSGLIWIFAPEELSSCLARSLAHKVTAKTLSHCSARPLITQSLLSQLTQSQGNCLTKSLSG